MDILEQGNGGGGREAKKSTDRKSTRRGQWWTHYSRVMEEEGERLKKGQACSTEYFSSNLAPRKQIEPIH